jgi:hypothetical protein
MKFHKTWDGGPTAIGESFITVLAEQDMPFAHKFSPEAQAYKKNGFYETHRVRIDDGFLILGQIQVALDSAAPSYMSSSPNARGFRNRGVFYPDNADRNNALTYAGDGQAFTTAFDIGPQAVNMYRTRDGISFKSWFSWFYSQDPYSDFTSWVGAAALRRIPLTGKLDWTFGISRIFITGSNGSTDPDGFLQGTWMPQYLFLEDKVWYQVDMPHYANKRHGAPIFERVGPSTLVCLVRVYRRGDVGSSVEPNNTTTPLPYILISHDNGENWTPIDEAANNVFMNLLVVRSTNSQSIYNIQVASLWAFYAFPINRTECFISCVGTTRVYPDAPTVSNNTRIVGRLNLITSALTDIHVVEEPIGDAVPTEMAVMSVVYSQGKWLFAYADQYAVTSRPVVFRRTADFVTYETTVSSFTTEYTGALTILDKTTLLIPVYEPTTGQFALFETTDIGVTWKRRATIRKDAAAPPHETPYSAILMNRFNTLTMIRQEGLPANGYPSLPWVRDERVTAPEAP